MSDAVAVPVQSRSVPLRKPTSSEVASKIVAGLGVFALGVVLGGPLLYFGWTVAGIAALIFFGGGGLLVMLFSRDEVSECPFCGAALANLPKPNADGVPRPVQCRKCWEYSGLQSGFVSPYNPNAVEERPTFRSPLAQSVVWPRGCVQCGVEPTRFDEVGTFSVNKGLLVVGAVRVKTFKLPGVPYCAAHKKAVEMTTEIGNKLFLDWRSLAMMRRYIGIWRRIAGGLWSRVRRARVECLDFKRAGDTDLPVAGASQQLSLRRRAVRSTSTTMSPPGRFWSMDSYEGDLQSPVALHHPRVE